ncbi:MAG: cell division protein SepF [Mycobacteriales bacterium]
MPGAMRKMGIYLGLVEDDDNREQDVHDEQGADDDYSAEPGTRPYSGARATERGAAGRGHDVAFERTETADRVPVRSGYTAARSGERSASRSWSAEPATDTTYSTGPVAEPTTLRSITTLHPRTYNEAKQIGEAFREGVPVIMNLTEMSDADAKRLVDFAAGLIFGLRGDIERVTNKVFLLSPQNVTVTAEDKARIAERGFFNQS